MKKKNIIIWLWTLALLFIGAGFALADIRNDFVSFDKAFIPPLALTNVEKVKPSKKAMKALKQEWSSFKGKYYDSNPNDPDWKKDFDKADALIQKAGEIVKSEKNLFAAHETLEEIRVLFMELRKRNNIDYFVDLLTEFHEHMEFIFHAGKENTPESLSEKDISGIKSTLSEADAIWAKVEKTNLDSKLYDFSDEKMKEMQEYVTLESAALKKLGKALDKNDKAMIIKASMGIKPNYANLYKLFGDFESFKK